MASNDSPICKTPTLYLTNASWWLLIMSFFIRSYSRWVHVKGKGAVSHLWFVRIIRKMSCDLMSTCVTLFGTLVACDTVRLDSKTNLHQMFWSFTKGQVNTGKLLFSTKFIQSSAFSQQRFYFNILVNMLCITHNLQARLSLAINMKSIHTFIHKPYQQSVQQLSKYVLQGQTILHLSHLTENPIENSVDWSFAQ